MSDQIPLAYASPKTPGDVVADRIERAVAWMAIAYGVASAMSSAMTIAFMANIPGGGPVQLSSLGAVALTQMPAALLKGLLAVAGCMMVKRVRGGVRMLRAVCWIMIVGLVVMALLAAVLMAWQTSNYVSFSMLSSFFSGVAGAAFPGLLLLLPLRRESER